MRERSGSTNEFFDGSRPASSAGGDSRRNRRFGRGSGRTVRSISLAMADGADADSRLDLACEGPSSARRSALPCGVALLPRGESGKPGATTQCSAGVAGKSRRTTERFCRDASAGRTRLLTFRTNRSPLDGSGVRTVISKAAGIAANLGNSSTTRCNSRGRDAAGCATSVEAGSSARDAACRAERSGSPSETAATGRNVNASVRRIGVDATTGLLPAGICTSAR